MLLMLLMLLMRKTASRANPNTERVGETCRILTGRCRVPMDLAQMQVILVLKQASTC
jgi:hypothetical protein